MNLWTESHLWLGSLLQWFAWCRRKEVWVVFLSTLAKFYAVSWDILMYRITVTCIEYSALKSGWTAMLKWLLSTVQCLVGSCFLCGFVLAWDRVLILGPILLNIYVKQLNETLCFIVRTSEQAHYTCWAWICYFSTNKQASGLWDRQRSGGQVFVPFFRHIPGRCMAPNDLQI